jgi:DNA polymerase-1
LRDGDVIAIDYETSGLKPDNDGHFIYSVSIYKLGDTISYSFLLTEGNIELLKAVLSNGKISKIGHNIKMEERWSRSILNTPVKGWVWDTCIGAHCINSTQGNSGLKFQAFVNFGREDYSTRVSQYIEAEQSNSLNRIRESPVELLLEYGAWDAYYTGLLYGIQRKTLESRTNNIGKPFTYGVEFFTLVQRAFAVMESTGIGFDVAMMESNEAGIKSKQQELETQFKQTGLFQTWQDAYGSKLNIYSSNQLGGVLFDKLKLDPPKLTEKGKWAVDEDALAEIEHPDLENFIRIKKYEKILGTYYSQFRREVSQHGILHCEMQLNTTRTYRTSCTKPNLQNISRTDKEQAQYIRGLFKSQFPDYVIVEADLKGCEVSGAACHTLDKNLITYVSDSNRDMHRDLAEVLYGIPNDQVSKELRSITKVYTFGSFYGSFWKLTGPHLWKLIHMHQPKLVDGTPVVDYLYDKGFTSVERYTEHVKSADEFMWYKQFPEYRKWKDWVYDEYLKTGYVDMFTGFRRYGPLNRNMVINTPIQGDSGHINLWLCCYVLSRINREKIPAKLFLQIHDSVVGLVHKEALDVYCQLYRDGIEALKKQWTWMITPFEIEYEVAPVGGSWYDKMEYKLK